MNIRLFFIVLLVILSVGVEAQKLRTLYYTSFWELTVKDSAEYYRVCRIDTVSNKFLGEVNDFNMKGQLLMKGFYKDGIKTGEFIFYYPNGQIESQGKFLKNHRIEIWNYFFPDGNPLQKIKFEYNSYELSEFDFSVIEAHDLDGKLVIKDGTGDWAHTYEEYGFPHLITVKGSFLKGKKEGIWTCTFSNGEFLYKETFKKGRFKSGHLTNPDGSEKESYQNEFQNKFLPHYKYEVTEKFAFNTYLSPGAYPFFNFIPIPDENKPRKDSGGQVFVVVERPPEYEGGLEAMFKFISKNLRYPASARRMQIEGIVLVTFIIDEDGKMIDPLISKGISADCDKEALRIVKMMPNWRPGMQSGKAVRVRFVVPIKFKLD